MSAAGDDDSTHGLILATDFSHEAANVIFGGKEKNLVPIFDHRLAFGAQAASIAIDRHHPRLGVRDMATQVAQCMTDQQAAAPCAQADESHFAAGKIQHLQCTGIANQTLNILSDQLLGADPDVD